jgi:tetratricopeptide (TPR) repeat protein
MNRAERRRQAKTQRGAAKAPSGKAAQVDQAIAQMIEPIVVLLNAQRFDQAEAALKELLAAAPNHAEGLHLYGLLLSQTGREEEGIGALRKATEFAPTIALYWNNLAAAYSRHHDWDASIAAARKAVDLDPTYAEPQYILTNVLLSQGNVAAGTDELTKLLKLRGDDVKMWLLLARNRGEQQRFDDAEQAYLKVLELTPKSIPAMRELATIYMNNWRYDDALRLRQEADRLDAEQR